MGNVWKGIIDRLPGRRRREDDIVMDDGEFEGLFVAEAGEAGPAEGGADFETMRALLLHAGECLQALAGTMQETNLRMAEILGDLQRELEQYCGGSAAEREEGWQDGGDGDTGC